MVDGEWSKVNGEWLSNGRANDRSGGQRDLKIMLKRHLGFFDGRDLSPFA